MIEAILRQLELELSPSEQILWLSAIKGFQVCAFNCSFPLSPLLLEPLPMRLEILFCQRGKLVIQWKDGHSISLEGGEILLLTDLSHVQSVQWMQEEMCGTLTVLETDPINGSFSELRALLGSVIMDTVQLGTIMTQLRGCAVISGNFWSSAFFEVLQRLPFREQGQYCTLITLELLYLICLDMQLLPWKVNGCYLDRWQTERVQEIHTYILAHLSQSVTISELTRQFHISSTSLKTCFRQLYGKPVHKYIQECRVHEASRLLLTTKQSVAKIANSVGYESVSQFGTIFRRHFHMSPAEYRTKMSESADVCPNPHGHSKHSTL